MLFARSLVLLAVSFAATSAAPFKRDLGLLGLGLDNLLDGVGELDDGLGFISSIQGTPDQIERILDGSIKIGENAQKVASEASATTPPNDIIAIDAIAEKVYNGAKRLADVLDELSDKREAFRKVGKVDAEREALVATGKSLKLFEASSEKLLERSSLISKISIEFAKVDEAVASAIEKFSSVPS